MASRTLFIRLLIGAIICIAFAAGFFVRAYFFNQTDEGARPTITFTDQQPFINPLLDFEYGYNRMFVPTNDLKRTIEKRILSVQREHPSLAVSVYYRDLNNGPWFGINEKQKFLPYSLLKVPIMIATLKLAETQPGLLHNTFTYDGRFDDTANTESIEHSLITGNTYSVADLLEKMIVYSDNVSKNILTQFNADHATSNDMTRIAHDLGLIVPTESSTNRVSVKDYAGSFRVLYNATYLSNESSAYALELLSRSSYDAGISSGVPAAIPVANKFGVGGEAGDDQKILHDCGIVYYPNKPYILCVMTQNADINTLESLISGISADTYSFVSGQ